jgi:WD40 repeat protein
LLQPLRDDNKTTQSHPASGLNLTLDWIRGRNARTPAFYCSCGGVLYAAGSIVVKVSTNKDGAFTQEYFMGHSGHVSSIDVFRMEEGGDLVATADVGRESKICVWSSSNLVPIVAIQCLHQCGISKLNFSPSGELLLTLSNGKANSIAVYNWRERKVLFTSTLSTDVYDCSFLSTDNSFGVCTREAVFFWTRREPKMPYLRCRGVFDRLSTREVMTTFAVVGDSVITLSLSGRVWVWEGRVCTKVATLRLGPVTHLYAPRKSSNNIRLCISTQCGSIHLLDSNLQPLHDFRPNTHLDEQSERIIDVVCYHPEYEHVLFGQKGNCLYQISVHDKETTMIVASGHPGVQGISVKDKNVVTVGGNMIKIWDAKQHSCLSELYIDAKLSCVSCNSRDDQIAVGFHADCPRSSLYKSFVILNGSDLRIIHHGCNSQETLTCCTYSIDGELLAFGSTDSSIYVHRVTDKGLPLLTKIRGHSSQLSRIDFGHYTGLHYLRSNSAGGEAMFWTTGGKVCTPLSTRDTVWETQTCIYTPAFEKIHSSYDESNSEVTSCCPLPNHGGQSIIVGDSDGNIRVFAHPYTADRPLFFNCIGHSGAIQSIVVSADDYTVHTMSHGDSCLFQWKCTVLNWGQGLPVVSSRNGKLPSAGSSATGMDMESMIKQMDSLDFRASEGRKDVIRKPGPWTRSIVAPSNFVPSELDLPEINLFLERIHGYSGNGVKNNVHALDDHIVYVVGKHLVRHNVEQNSQLFCNLNGEISCLSIHRERSLCAIGHAGAHGISDMGIQIVDMIQMKSLTFLNNHSGGVAFLNFDESGKYIVSVGNIGEIVVHDWKNGSTVANSQTYGFETHDIKFLKGSSNRIIECGTCFVRFWSIHGCSLRFEEVTTLDSLENQTQYYSCIGWNGDNIMVGSSTGQIVPFSGNEPGKRIKAHQSAVTNLSSTKDGILSCNNDSVKLWNSSMRCMLSISTQDVGIKYSISSVSWANDVVFVGNSGNEIWQLSSDDGPNLNWVGKALVSTHASLPMGLSVSSNGSFATTGDDGILRLWNVFDHQEMKSFDLNMPSRSCAFSPDLLGRMIAVGFGKPEKENARIVDGKWIVLSVSDEGVIQTIAERRDVKKYITQMKWHSSGDRLAVGSGDKKLCVYSMKSDTMPAIKVDITMLSMIDLTSPPIHFDFSVDGKYLRANYECQELHFFEAGPGLHIKESSKLKDVHWETETCIFSWNVQGVWCKDGGNEIVSLDCTPQEPCPSIAAGDRHGDLQLYQFPCTSKVAQCMTYPAHLGPVGKVSWLPGYLVSVGMNDNAIMVWRQEVDEGFADRRHLDVLFGSHLVDSNATSPSDEFVCHSALYDLNDERVIYPLSGNVEVFDKRRHATDIPVESFQKHDATVVALCISNSRLLVATADIKTIRIWDPQTCAEIATLSNERQRNISSLSFSFDDMKVLSVSSGGLFLWMAINGDWSDTRLAFHTLAGREKVHFALFDAGRNNIVSGGRRHVNFWSERHSTLVLSKGVLSENCIHETFVCGVSVNESLLITGTRSGSFVIWKETKIVEEIKAHNDCVVSLCACPEGFISGCAKGVIILWSANLQKVASYDVFAKSTSSPIGSIDMISHSNRCETTKILVRTESRDIYEISCVTGWVSLLCKIGSSQAAPYAEPNPIYQPRISPLSSD